MLYMLFCILLKFMNNSSIKHPCQFRFCYLKRFIITIKASFFRFVLRLFLINDSVLECQYLSKIQFISNNCKSNENTKEKKRRSKFLGFSRGWSAFFLFCLCWFFPVFPLPLLQSSHVSFKNGSIRCLKSQMILSPNLKTRKHCNKLASL